MNLPRRESLVGCDQCGVRVQLAPADGSAFRAKKWRVGACSCLCVRGMDGWDERGWRARRSLRREVRRRERAYQRRIKVDQKAQWLDMVRPGWARLVNADVLDVWSGTQCVLGQVFSNGLLRLAAGLDSGTQPDP